MAFAALIAWLITVGLGWSLLAIWLVEYDSEFHSAAATRLPVPVMSAHALLALAGLAVWLGYLLTDTSKLAWTAAAILVVVAILGFTMAARWLRVYRAHQIPSAAEALTGARRRSPDVPPERHLPLPVVIGHGLFAAATIVLVVLTALNIGGS